MHGVCVRFDWRRALIWALWLLASLVMLALLVSAAFTLAMRAVPDYREKVEQRVSAAVGYPLKIGRMNLSWRGFLPTLNLRDVALLPKNGVGNAPTLLHLGELRLAFSPWRLLQADAWPVNAELRGLVLRADVDEVGHWSLRGFDGASGGDAGAVLADLQRLQRLRLIACQLEVHDATLPLPGTPLLFEMRLADIEHRGETFRIRADVEPPPSMAGIAELHGAIAGDLGHLESLNGGWTLTMRELRGWPWAAQELADHAALQLRDARVRFDGTLKAGQVTLIEVKASAAEVAAQRDAHRLAQISKLQIYGRAEPTAQCWKLDISDLELDGARGHWSAGSGHYECTRDDNGIAVTASVGLLRLDDLAPWLGLWKDLPAAVDRVQDLRGDLQDLTLSSLPPNANDGAARRGLKFEARLHEGGLAAHGGQSGISGLSGHIAADQDGGQLQLDNTALQLILPTVFQQPFPVESLTGELSWRHQDRDWHLSAPQFAWAALGTQGSGQFDLLLAADAPPRISIAANFSSTDATLLKPYIPLNWQASTRDWLSRALVKVAVPKAALILEGALPDYPFTASGSGRWSLDLQLADATLAFAPDWPPIEQLYGLLSLHGNGISIDADRGKIGANEIDHVHAAIADFRDAQLSVDGSIHGASAQFYEVLRASPMHQKLAGLLDKTDISGAAQLDLKLNIPLAAAQQTRASGQVNLSAVSLKVHGLDQPIRNILGAVNFDDAGVHADALSGSFYAHPLNASIHAESGVPGGVIEAQTQLSLKDDDGLASAYLPDWLQRQLSGETELRARLPLGGPDEGRLIISSDLRGVRSRLPPPLAKNADDALPITAHLGSDAQTPLRLGLEVADVMRLGVRFGAAGASPNSASLNIRSMTARGIELRLDGGAIPHADADGIVVDGAPEVLDLAPWIALVADLGTATAPAGITPAPNVAARASAGAASSTTAPAIAAAREPPLSLSSVDLRPQKLQYGDFVLLQPHFHAQPIAGGYRVELDGASAQGSIDWSKTDRGHVVARMQHLAFEAIAPHAEGAATTQPEAADNMPPFAPARAPTFDLSIDQLQLGAANFGHMSLTTSRVADGQQLDRLELQGGDLQLNANGAWRRATDLSSAELACSIDSTNIGAVFTAIGYPQTLVAKQSNIKAALSWLPNAAGLQWAQAKGTVELASHKGDLKSVEPGAGRALGLFSLYALPRHLLLDFRDVFAKGLSFDQLEGKFALGDGQARTDRLVIKSPSLRIVMHGRIGLADRDYDEHVTVYPDVTTSVTIAGGLAGGPVGAAIALVAQEALGKPFNTLSQFSYHVTGPWDNPQIKHGEAGKDECPEDTPADVKSPTDAQGKPCSRRVERKLKVEPATAPMAEPAVPSAIEGIDQSSSSPAGDRSQSPAPLEAASAPSSPASPVTQPLDNPAAANMANPALNKMSEPPENLQEAPP
jgi:uncharacterized protein (TIGR02099 family)